MVVYSYYINYGSSSFHKSGNTYIEMITEKSKQVCGVFYTLSGK